MILELFNMQIEELRRHIRVILADSGVIEKVQATPFEVAIGSSGTIESIEQMINLTSTTLNDTQVVVTIFKISAFFTLCFHLSVQKSSSFLDV